MLAMKQNENLCWQGRQNLDQFHSQPLLGLKGTCSGLGMLPKPSKWGLIWGLGGWATVVDKPELAK